MPTPGPSQDRQQQQQEIKDVLDELDKTLAKVYQVVDGMFLGKKPTKSVVDDLCDEAMKFNVQLHKLQVATKEPTAQQNDK